MAENFPSIKITADSPLPRDVKIEIDGQPLRGATAFSISSDVSNTEGNPGVTTLVVEVIVGKLEIDLQTAMLIVGQVEDLLTQIELDPSNGGDGSISPDTGMGEARKN